MKKLTSDSSLPDRISGTSKMLGNVHLASLNVLNKTVSVRQFGGVGDGITDDTEALQKAVDYLKEQKQPNSSNLKESVSRIQDFLTLDFESGHYLISRPIRLRFMYGCIISNGAVTASKDFPIDEYLFDFNAVNTAKVENILFECRKRANGIFCTQVFSTKN